MSPYSNPALKSAEVRLAHYSNTQFSRGRSRLTEALWLLAQWALVSSWIPGAVHRRWLLRVFGAKVGKGVQIKPGIRVKFPWRLEVGDHSWIGEDVWIDNLAPVTIASNCCISQRAYLCTGSHDWSCPTFDLIVRPIEVKRAAWIAACSTVGPGVTVGEGAVLGLGSVAARDLEPWTIYMGSPAEPVRKREIKVQVKEDLVATRSFRMPDPGQRTANGPEKLRRERLLYLCDWLPPDYGAVGQYSLQFARELAAEGRDVVLAGLSSRASSDMSEAIGQGHIRQIRLGAVAYDKTSILVRLLWTVRVNTRLIWRLRWQLCATDVVVFTGSPPYLIHWLAPLNLFLRKKLIYRITDFHPECLIAQRGSGGFVLRGIYWLTLFWRRRIDEFEALGIDQMERLAQIGISETRVRLKRDPSPVEIGPGTRSLMRPEAARGKLLLLYSGNWGVAHDYSTFVSGYLLHHRQGSARFVLWLNAVGSAVNTIADQLAHHQLPFIRGVPVPLKDLASLLVTPDAHLITLSDPFVGYVLPSKVHASIQSGLPILYVGSAFSDVHRLCTERMRAPYVRVDVGDVQKCWQAIENLARSCQEEERTYQDKSR
jgi:acetyltransferase-like isoleucine patch superfamily enzyme